jgi:putative transposase
LVGCSKDIVFKEIILQAVYLKLRFSLSYRDVEELLAIRGVVADHATIQRWVFKFTPLIKKVL